MEDPGATMKDIQTKVDALLVHRALEAATAALTKS